MPSTKEMPMRVPVFRLAAVCLMLSGCNEKAAETSEAAGRHGRYAGIGVFEASPQWAKLAGVPQAKDPAQARLTDDAHVIVVVDTKTGEVRQCGDLSGYCLAMNPWKGTPGALPALLTAHATAGADEVDAAQSTPANERAPGDK
jgi:hypothetical protein